MILRTHVWVRWVKQSEHMSIPRDVLFVRSLCEMLKNYEMFHTKAKLPAFVFRHVAEQNACMYVCTQTRHALYVLIPEIHQINRQRCSLKKTCALVCSRLFRPYSKATLVQTHQVSTEKSWVSLFGGLKQVLRAHVWVGWATICQGA